MRIAQPGEINAAAGPWWAPRCWAVWSLPRPVLLYVGAVDLAALAVAGADTAPVSARAGLWCALLVAGLLAHKEAARHIERSWGQAPVVEGRPQIRLQATWFLAALLILPSALVTVVVVVAYAGHWLRAYRPPAYPHREVFSAAAVLLSLWSAGRVLAAILGHPSAPLVDELTGIRGLGALLAACATYWLVNAALVFAVIIATNPAHRDRITTAGRRDQPAGFGRTEQLLIGASTGLAVPVALLVTTQPWLLPVLLATMLALHAGLLLPQFQTAARTDAKTGLANTQFWHERADRELARARAAHDTVGVLMIDLDHFRAVNNEHGHLPGDEVLCAVARAIQQAVRRHDLVGRFGGEEFAVLAPGCGATSLSALAERIRLAINQVSIATMANHGPVTIADLTASVGAAIAPTAAPDLTGLLLAADTALYAAKNSGRNRTCFAGLAASDAAG